MITLKISGKKTVIPTEWSDVTYSQYVALIDTNNSLPEYISLFTGIPLETLLKAELKNLEVISIALSFLTISPKMEAKPTQMVGNYTLPKDITLSSLGQFEDLRNLLKQLPKSLETKEEQKQVSELYLEACAIYTQKIIHGEYDPERVPKVKEELKNYSCIEVLQTGGFFFKQASEYITEYQDTLPEYSPTPEEIDSGLSWLSEDFGPIATIYQESERMSIAPETFMHKWNAREFYHLVRFHAWQAHGQNEYQKLISLKHSVK